MMIGQDEDQSSQMILEKISDSFFIEPEYLKDETKAHVIKTFTTFINL